MFNTKPVMGVIAVFSILFNGTLCIVILRKREMLRKSYHLLIFVLAITDTLAGEKYNDLYQSISQARLV